MNRVLVGYVLAVLWMTAGCATQEDSSFAGSGVIEAKEITVSAETPGKLVRLAVDEGDVVEKGQDIAGVDVETLVLQREVASADLAELFWRGKVLEKEMAVADESISQASVTLENVRKIRDRIANLFEQGVAAQDRLDQAETELSLAVSRLRAAEKKRESIETQIGSLQAARDKIEANLRLLDSRISDSRIYCPIDCVVLEKYREAGEVVNFGTPLCLLADVSEVWLKIYVGEDMLGKLQIGSPATIAVDSYPDARFEGTITWISSQAEFTPKNVLTRDARIDLVYGVKITVPNAEGIFKIGMPADAYIEGL